MPRNALKTAETIDGSLAPALTAWDLKVLRGVPARVDFGEAWSPAGRGLDQWLIARSIRVTDITAVRSTLRGLHDRHLVVPIGYETQRKFQRWARTEEGDRRAAA